MLPAHPDVSAADHLSTQHHYAALHSSVPLPPLQDSDEESEFEPSSSTSSDDDSCTLDPNDHETETAPSPDLLAPAGNAKRQKTGRAVRLPARLGDGNSLLSFAGRPSPPHDDGSSEASLPHRPVQAARAHAASSGTRRADTAVTAAASSSPRNMPASAGAYSMALPAGARPSTLNDSAIARSGDKGGAAGSGRLFGIGTNTARSGGLGGASVSTAGAPAARAHGAASVGGSGARGIIVDRASTADELHRIIKPATPLVKAALCGMLMYETAPSMYSVRNFRAAIAPCGWGARMFMYSLAPACKWASSSHVAFGHVRSGVCFEHGVALGWLLGMFVISGTPQYS